MDEGSRRLAALRGLLEREPSGISEEISPSDEMNNRGLDHYRRVGLSALRCIVLSLLAAGKDKVDAILDLPCGYGRVLRVLARAFPGARLTAGDLDRGAVEFCARAFGATPLHSSEDPGRILVEGQFDLVWCGSLFTHLNAERWPGFLRLFESILGPGGVLVFTTHGRLSARWVRAGARTYGLDPAGLPALLEEWDQTGFGYRDYPGQAKYGISVSSPSWVFREIQRFESLQLVLYGEAAWHRHQDVVACLRI